jgi:3-oxoacyl-[acyl-carrier-protein] synthase-3
MNVAENTWIDHRTLSVMGTGQAYPGEPIATQELAERIHARFGIDLTRRTLALGRKLNIHHRFLARDFATRVEGTRPGDGNADLAARAVRDALRQAGLRSRDLVYLIGHTVTPAELVPSNISKVAHLLGYHGPVAEFRQACTGFVNATLFAAGLSAVVGGRPVAVVGSETGSVFFDPQRATEDLSQLVNFVQMGDGAGAIIVGGEQNHTRTPRISHLYHGRLENGRTPGLRMRTGGSLTPGSPTSVLEFDHAPSLVREQASELFEGALAALRAQEMDWMGISHVLPHQANGRMDQLLAAHLPSSARVIVHADRVGNTGSAAIWLALAEARAHLLASGEKVVVLGAESTNYSYGGFVYEHA